MEADFFFFFFFYFKSLPLLWSIWCTAKQRRSDRTWFPWGKLMTNLPAVSTLLKYKKMAIARTDLYVIWWQLRTWSVCVSHGLVRTFFDRFDSLENAYCLCRWIGQVLVRMNGWDFAVCIRQTDLLFKLLIKYQRAEQPCNDRFYEKLINSRYHSPFKFVRRFFVETNELQRTKKALISLRVRAGWSAPLFAHILRRVF